MNAGEVHAIMGKNGSGKSTLAQVIAGRDTYEITDGSIAYKGKDLTELSAEERAREGIFLAFNTRLKSPASARATSFVPPSTRCGSTTATPSSTRWTSSRWSARRWRC
jgi:Fe-S cluster assembly ATPase SufC